MTSEVCFLVHEVSVMDRHTLVDHYLETCTPALLDSSPWELFTSNYISKCADLYNWDVRFQRIREGAHCVKHFSNIMNFFVTSNNHSLVLSVFLFNNKPVLSRVFTDFQLGTNRANFLILIVYLSVYIHLHAHYLRMI